MATATQGANLFELSCDGTQITFSTSSFAGPPQFSYSGPEGNPRFSGDDIDTLASALGTEVTVTLETVPDLHNDHAHPPVAVVQARRRRRIGVLHAGDQDDEPHDDRRAARRAGAEQ
jgi:hypothetical protein